MTIVLSTTVMVSAQSPATLSPEDGDPLPLMAEARRAELLGSREVYRLAIYGRMSIRDKADLASPETAKLVRVVVTYDDDLYRRVLVDWSRELTPRIELPAAEVLRARFLSLRKGSVVQIEYVPSKGTTIRIDRAVVTTGAHHDLMLAFLDLWLGQRPLSEDLKRALIESTR